LKSFHESALAAVTESDNGKRGVLRIGVDDSGEFERAHFAHVGGANYGGGRVVLERGQRKGRLRAREDFEAFALEGVAEALGEIDIAVDEKNFGDADWFGHEGPYCMDAAGTGPQASAPGVSAFRFRT